jgi:hypothetical protein
MDDPVREVGKGLSSKNSKFDIYLIDKDLI